MTTGHDHAADLPVPSGDPPDAAGRFPRDDERLDADACAAPDRLARREAGADRVLTSPLPRASGSAARVELAVVAAPALRRRVEAWLAQVPGLGRHVVAVQPSGGGAGGAGDGAGAVAAGRAATGRGAADGGLAVLAPRLAGARLRPAARNPGHRHLNTGIRSSAVGGLGLRQPARPPPGRGRRSSPGRGSGRRAAAGSGRCRRRGSRRCRCCR